MDVDATKTVAHFLTVIEIVSIEGHIWNDTMSAGYSVVNVVVPFNLDTSLQISDLMIEFWNNAAMVLRRNEAGLFDSTSFSMTMFNRGRIKITYV